MKRIIKTTLTIVGLVILSFLLYAFIPSYPGTREFYKVISESDRIVIKELSAENESLVWESVFESDDPKDITSFADSLLIKKQSPFVRWICKCTGTHAIYLYKNGQETMRITNHHNESIRCDLWEGNVNIDSVDEWNSWLDSHLISNEENKMLTNHSTLR